MDAPAWRHWTPEPHSDSIQNLRRKTVPGHADVHGLDFPAVSSLILIKLALWHLNGSCWHPASSGFWAVRAESQTLDPGDVYRGCHYHLELSWEVFRSPLLWRPHSSILCSREHFPQCLWALYTDVRFYVPNVDWMTWDGPGSVLSSISNLNFKL